MPFESLGYPGGRRTTSSSLNRPKLHKGQRNLPARSTLGCRSIVQHKGAFHGTSCWPLHVWSQNSLSEDRDLWGQMDLLEMRANLDPGNTWQSPAPRALESPSKSCVGRLGQAALVLGRGRGTSGSSVPQLLIAGAFRLPTAKNKCLVCRSERGGRLSGVLFTYHRRKAEGTDAARCVRSSCPPCCFRPP